MSARRSRWALHTRVAVAFGLSMSVVVGIVLLLWIRGSEEYELELAQRLNRDVARHLAEHSVPLTPEGIDPGALQGMLMHVMSVNPALEVYLLDEAGEILAFDAPEGHVKATRVDLAPVQEILEGGELPILGQDPRAPGEWRPISVWPLRADGEGGGPTGYVYVVLGGEELRATAGPLRGNRHLAAFLQSVAGVLLVGVLANFLLARVLTRPLRSLGDAIRSRREGLPRELLEAGAEIGQLARTYDEMEERIREQLADLGRVDRDRREFVASVSHDLRTPLASLQGYLELLDEAGGRLSDEQQEYVAIARRQALQLSHLVDQLFQLAKLEAGDVQPRIEEFNLAELTQDVLQGLRQRAFLAGVQLRCRLPRSLPPIRGDLGLMERAVTNLVDNALKFTPQGGEVSVRLQSTSAGVTWSVQDDGPGISEEDVEQVFERNFRGGGTSLAKGAGLGLAITRRVLELHDASIDVESTLGRGSLFRFSLPAV